jgi:hypothetical protein
VPSRFLQKRYSALNIDLCRKAETQDFTDRHPAPALMIPQVIIVAA